MSDVPVKLPKRKLKQRQKIQALLRAAGLNIDIGTWFIERNGNYYFVSNIAFDAQKRLQIYFSHYYRDDPKPHLYGDFEIKELKDKLARHEYVQVEKPTTEAEDAALAIFNDPEKIKALNPYAASEELSDSTALVPVESHDHLKNMRALLTQKQNEVAYIKAVVARRLDLLQAQMHEMQAQMKVVKKLIGVIELYLGVYEEIVQIKQGAPAAETEPITIFQQVLYMDEECGDPRDRGIDYRKVDQFDAWLLSAKANIPQIIPAVRGIRALKPSRQYREYSDNWVDNADKNAQNQMMYLLIKNGDALYRIWTNTRIGGRLIPGANELSELIGAMQDDRHPYWDKEKHEGEVFVYKTWALLLQGLIDRTQILYPLKHYVSLLKPETYGDLLRFVRDDEYTLGDGRKPFKEWKKDINARITEGSRVLIANELFGNRYYYESHHQHDNYGDRFLYYSNNYPELPPTGVYTAYAHRHKERWSDETVDCFRILYNPKDTIWDNSWNRYGLREKEHERKRRISFVIYPDDDFVFNYDALNVEDVKFYMQSRADRPNYLKVIPLLWDIRDLRIQEVQWEKQFVALVVHRLGVSEHRVWAAVRWWKLKNKWKRPIAQDDVLALRMIEKKLKHEI